MANHPLAGPRRWARVAGRVPAVSRTLGLRTRKTHKNPRGRHRRYTMKARKSAHLGLMVLLALAIAVLVQACGSGGEQNEQVDSTQIALIRVSNCPSGYNIIEGTPGDDVLMGTPGSDCILGHGGNDDNHWGGGDYFLAGGLRSE